MGALKRPTQPVELQSNQSWSRSEMLFSYSNMEENMSMWMLACKETLSYYTGTNKYLWVRAVPCHTNSNNDEKQTRPYQNKLIKISDYCATYNFRCSFMWR